MASHSAWDLKVGSGEDAELTWSAASAPLRSCVLASQFDLVFLEFGMVSLSAVLGIFRFSKGLNIFPARYANLELFGGHGWRTNGSARPGPAQSADYLFGP